MTADTAAEKRETLVEYGARRYRETFLTVFLRACAGQRVPGMTHMDDAALRAFFRKRPVEEWAVRAQTTPQAALAELKQWTRLEDADAR